MKQLLLFAFSFSIVAAQAQSEPRFFASVEVEFEKTVNVRSLYKAADPEFFEEYKDRVPPTVLSYHVFTGDTAQSVYKPGKETTLDPQYWYRPVADKNVVFTDYRQQQMVAQKPVFEETFLVQDSLTNIKWKLTADTRTIAGYECRKAVGILDDSVAIFAFYTDEILISGGPETAHGLPGMILGMGIPRLHTTWFATKVSVNGVDLKAVQAPKKGKKATRDEMMKQLGGLMRQWGTWGSRMIVQYTI